MIITIDGGGVDYKDGRENYWGDLDSHPNSNGITTATTIWNGEDKKITPIKMFDGGDINIGKYWDVCTYHIFLDYLICDAIHTYIHQ